MGILQEVGNGIIKMETYSTILFIYWRLEGIYDKRGHETGCWKGYYENGGIEYK
jgi:hypothetical protein